jgi:hypothetical protein
MSNFVMLISKNKLTFKKMRRMHLMKRSFGHRTSRINTRKFSSTTSFLSSTFPPNNINDNNSHSLRDPIYHGRSNTDNHHHEQEHNEKRKSSFDFDSYKKILSITGATFVAVAIGYRLIQILELDHIKSRARLLESMMDTTPIEDPLYVDNTRKWDIEEIGHLMQYPHVYLLHSYSRAGKSELMKRVNQAHPDILSLLISFRDPIGAINATSGGTESEMDVILSSVTGLKKLSSENFFTLMTDIIQLVKDPYSNVSFVDNLMYSYYLGWNWQKRIHGKKLVFIIDECTSALLSQRAQKFLFRISQFAVTRALDFKEASFWFVTAKIHTFKKKIADVTSLRRRFRYYSIRDVTREDCKEFLNRTLTDDMFTVESRQQLKQNYSMQQLNYLATNCAQSKQLFIDSLLDVTGNRIGYLADTIDSTKTQPSAKPSNRDLAEIFITIDNSYMEAILSARHFVKDPGVYRLFKQMLTISASSSTTSIHLASNVLSETSEDELMDAKLIQMTRPDGSLDFFNHVTRLAIQQVLLEFDNNSRSK